MTAKQSAINRPAIIAKTVKDVFEMMLSLTVTPREGEDVPTDNEQILGSVGLASDTVAGSVHLQLSVTFAAEVTGRLLGAPAQTALAVNDAVGELTNMVAGAPSLRIVTPGISVL